ncbi:DNA topoisomerase IB [Rhizobium sp. 3T7]|uniref:DNA topoisomerase IB n=1 Tax=Rhizobium sp. 3T7 TaxID=2874922 RepID=UPI001CCB3A94|nr:DNA topoisomerase IB [Rhizobium sp. 3T7]MBZ9792584.1 DNA topoisomerase IB [Rhizobium sp. 3T7]
MTNMHSKNAIDAVVAEAKLSTGVVYLSSLEAGITRRRGKKGFLYYAPDGRRLTNKEEITRLNSLAIPPAYRDVIISADARSHLQAVGIDTRGRKQYRYDPEWQAERERAKFDRLADFGMRLPDIRERVDRDLRARGLTLDKALATVVWMLDNLYIRIGNAGYAEANKSYGLTTLRNRHVKIDGATVRFRFKRKSGKERNLTHSDRRITNVIRRLQELPGQQLFKYLCDGDCRQISSQDANAYIRGVAGDEFTSRQFRTWGATCLAVAALAPLDTASSERAVVSQMNEAIDLVAAKLVNTRAVCRSSYIHPAVFRDFRAGRLGDVPRRKTTRQRLLRWLDEEESAVLRWLKSQRGE